MMKNLYFDYAAAAPIDERVQREMLRVMAIAGNPSSYNDEGRRAVHELNTARLAIARFLGAHAGEVIFTASGSEANNMAVFGVVACADMRHDEIMTTPIEHPSVLEPIRHIADKGYEVKYIGVDGRGLVNSSDIGQMINKRTLLISVMYANNEIGSIEPIADIGRVIRAWREKHQTAFPFFHVDACQAAGALPMDVHRLGADLLVFNGSKIGGPRGTGVLYIRSGVPLGRFIWGGGQEFGLRAGTENLPAIVGLAKAVACITKKESERLAGLRDFFFARLKRALPGATINGPLGSLRLPNNAHISIPGLESEHLLLELDRYGIRAGSGSACTARAVEPSHVLRAIGVRPPYLDGVLRFSFGRGTRRSDVEVLLKALPEVVAKIRKRYRR